MNENDENNRNITTVDSDTDKVITVARIKLKNVPFQIIYKFQHIQQSIIVKFSFQIHPVPKLMYKYILT